MNKRLLYLLLIASTFIITSCHRNWNCECQTVTNVVSVESVNETKSDAQLACDKYSQTTYAQTGGCKLK